MKMMVGGNGDDDTDDGVDGDDGDVIARRTMTQTMFENDEQHS